MADEAAPGGPGPANAADTEHLRLSVARIVPPAFLGVALVYGASVPFLPFLLPSRVAVPLAATAGLMAVGLAWFATQVRRGRVPARQVQPLVAALLGCISTQALLYNVLVPGQPVAPSLLMLTVGAGILVVDTRMYAPLLGLFLVQWGLLPVVAPDPVDNLQAHLNGLVAAAVVGPMAHILRRRGLVEQGRAQAAFERRGEELAKALRHADETAATLRVLSSATTEGIAIHRDGTVLEANDAFWRLLRRTGARSGVALAEHVAPESQETLARRLRDGTPGPIEVAMRRADGSRFMAEMESRAIVHAGRPAEVAVVRELTLNRAEERRFKELLESAPDAILLADAAGRVLLVNAEAERLFGRGRGSILGNDLAGLVRGEDRDRLDAVRRATLAGLPVPTPGSLTLLAARPNGQQFPVELAVRTLHTPDGPLLLASLRDVTDRRKAEEADRIAFERLLQIEQLRRMDEFRTQFLNTASHELNTPITPVRLQLHLLKNGSFGELNSEQARSVDVIDRNVARLAALVQDLLDVARLEGGQIRLELSDLDARRVAEEALEAFVPAAGTRGIHLGLDPGRVTPVRGDPRRLGQVLFNLLSNALKFTPTGGRITVHVEARGPEVMVAVADTGIGLRPDQLERLFKPFSQVHEDRALRNAGTGLGLYICRGIVEAHGGRLWAESPGPGQGSTFRFAIPSRTPAARGEAGAGDERGPPDGSGERPGNEGKGAGAAGGPAPGRAPSEGPDLEVPVHSPE